MNEEEKEAIESLRIKAEYIGENYSFGKQGIKNLKKDLNIALNLISKLQEEVKEEGTELAHIAKLFNQNTNRLETISRKLGLTKKNENGFIYDEIVKEVDKLQKELDKKDKVINLMAEKYLSYCDFCNDFNDKNEVKQYFYKKVEKENE